jgi:hypothetical protein
MARQTVKGCTSKPNSSPYSLGFIWGVSENKVAQPFQILLQERKFPAPFLSRNRGAQGACSRYRCINRRKNAVETEYLSATSAVVSPDSRAPNMRFRRSIDVMAAIVHPWHNKFQLMMVYKVATLLGWAL